MIIDGRKIIADDGKMLDFKEPHYAQNEKGEPVQVHLYSKTMRMGKLDSADNYIEIDFDEEKMKEV